MTKDTKRTPQNPEIGEALKKVVEVMESERGRGRPKKPTYKTYASIDSGKTQTTNSSVATALLKRIYNDGALGNPRSLSEDLQTLGELL
jgi:hypothetical protein